VRTISIAGRDVPYEDGEVPVVHFAGGRRGASEAGPYEFWTVYGPGGHCTARWPKGKDDPGERFRRMEHSAADADCWRLASRAVGIRPATEDEVIAWLSQKPGDSPFAESCQIGSRKLMVVRTAQGISLEVESRSNH